MINRVLEIGRLTRDVELKKTSSGKSVATFNLAVAAYSKGENSTYFFECVAWNVTADNLARYSNKGDLLAIDGHLVQENYQDKAGTKRNKTKIVADIIQYLSDKKDKEETQKVESNDKPEYKDTKDIPVREDDELPF